MITKKALFLCVAITLSFHAISMEEREKKGDAEAFSPQALINLLEKEKEAAESQNTKHFKNMRTQFYKDLGLPPITTTIELRHAIKLKTAQFQVGWRINKALGTKVIDNAYQRLLTAAQPVAQADLERMKRFIQFSDKLQITIISLFENQSESEVYVQECQAIKKLYNEYKSNLENSLERLKKLLKKASVFNTETDIDTFNILIDDRSTLYAEDLLQHIINFLMKFKVQIEQAVKSKNERAHNLHASPVEKTHSHDSNFVLIGSGSLEMVRKHLVTSAEDQSEEELEIRRLLENTTDDVNTADKSTGNTLLHAAAEKCSGDLIRELIARGAQVNAQNVQKDTPLHETIKYKNVGAAKELLNHGADVTLQNDMSWTPLHLAVHVKNLEIVQELLAHKAEADVRDSRNITPLWLAVNSHQIEIIKALVAQGAGIETVDLSKLPRQAQKEIRTIAAQRNSHISNYATNSIQPQQPLSLQQNAQIGYARGQVIGARWAEWLWAPSSVT